MTYETLQDVLRDFNLLSELGELQHRDLCSFIRRTISKADAVWNATTETHDDLEEAYQRGRAHALCEILGDQQWLAAAIDRDYPLL